MTFEEWLPAHLPPLLRLATALSGSPPAAEDLVQDVLIKAHARWARIQTLDHPDAYVRRMLVNEHLSWRRRLASVLRRDASNEVGEVDHRRPFDQEWVDRTELVTEIRRLPPRQRAVIVLRYLDELTIAETARTLGCTESTVRATTSRALAALRVRLPAATGEAPPTPNRQPRPAEDHHAH